MTIVRCPSCAGTENYHEPHCQQECDNLRAVNEELLKALGALAEANDAIYNAKLSAAAALEEARK